MLEAGLELAGAESQDKTTCCAFSQGAVAAAWLTFVDIRPIPPRKPAATAPLRSRISARYSPMTC